MNYYIILTLLIISILSLSYVLLRFFYYYFKEINRFMICGDSFRFNSNIDRPRVYFNFIFIPFSFYLFFHMKTNSLNNYSMLIEQFASMFLFIISILLCQFTWSKSFLRIFNKQNEINVFNNFSSLDLSNESIESIYNSLNDEGYIKGELESFKLMVNNEPLEKCSKIIWNDYRGKKLNKQTLIELLSNIFPNLDHSSNIEIIDFINKYFVDSNSKSLFKNIKNPSKIVTDWRNNESKYLNEVSTIIRPYI